MIFCGDSNGNVITYMKEFDALKYSCNKCDKTNCEERKNYEKAENKNMKHKYYISCSIENGFIGLYYCIDYTLDNIDGIQKVQKQIQKDGYGDVVILFFKELI